MDISDMRSVRQASASLQNDVNNLKRRIDTSAFPDAELDGKVWSFQGSSGRHVLVDRRNPEKFDTSNARYTASSWKVGFRSTEINPLTGTHSYDTGNLYRTVHWRDIGNGFGLNGYFTNDLARAGMWKNEGGQPASHSPAGPTHASPHVPSSGGTDGPCRGDAGLNNTLTKSKTLENPNQVHSPSPAPPPPPPPSSLHSTLTPHLCLRQWGTPKIQPTFM